jgi:CBS domain-containing protein
VTTARDLMRPCPTVTEGATVSDMVRLLADTNCSALAVLDARGRLSGIVTEANLVELIYESGEFEFDEAVVGGRLPTFLGYTPEQLKALPAVDMMTNGVDTVAPDTTLEDVAKAMFRGRRKVLLVAVSQQVLGAVHRMDVIRRVLG